MFYDSEKCSFSDHVWSNWEPEKSRLTSLTSDNFTPNLGLSGRHALARFCRDSPGPTAYVHGSPLSATNMGHVLVLHSNACVVLSARTEELQRTTNV